MSESTGFDPKDHWDIRAASAQPGKGGGERRRRISVDSTWIPVAATMSLLTVTMYFGYQLRSLALTSSPPSRTRGMMLLAEALVAGKVSWKTYGCWWTGGLTRRLTVPRILDNIHILSIWRRDGIQRPSLLLHAENVPMVDVFITYCGEGIQLALDTVRATCALDYPSTRFRIIILDDSGSQTLASALATNFKAFDNVYYTSRNEKISIHSKAGNLNWGLKYTALLVGGASDFLAVLDVDMIPTRDWLRRLLPHLLQNSRAAMDDRYDEGAFFIRHLEVVASLLDRSGNSMCSGTGFIARRKSIDAIGGFPTQSVAEGVLTSWKLKADGWQSAYVFERVQWGLGPRTVQSYVRQCEKTAIGAASLMEYAAQPSGTEKKSVLSQVIAAKLMLLLYTTPYWTSTLNMVVVPCALVSGGLQSGPGHVWPSIGTANILGLADFAAQYIYGFTISSLTGGRLPVFNHLSALWIAPHQLLALLLPHGLFKRAKSRQSQSYAPTNKSSDTETQVFSAPLVRRVKSALVNDLAFIHCAVLVLCTMSASFWAYQILEPHEYLTVTTRPILSHFILSLGWPPFLLVWTAYIANAWTPVSCLLFPPVRPARESLLVHDPNTGAAYPSQQAKDNWYRKKGGWHLYIVLLYHVLVLFAMLFLPDLADRGRR
ncbi:nucleotide-diphospho-sugar transferase [Usnea florida]